MNDNASGSMLTITEVARQLHIHNNTARRWANAGIIKAYCIGPRGDRRFKQEDINQYLTELSLVSRPKRRERLISELLMVS
jgi:excisionase family DNA binding protein